MGPHASNAIDSLVDGHAVPRQALLQDSLHTSKFHLCPGKLFRDQFICQEAHVKWSQLVIQ